MLITFLNPWYLAGLSAIAIPVLIHILQRDRIRRITFPATRFLLEASKSITRKQTLREWLLLLLRSALVAMLVFSFARPFGMKRSAADFVGENLKATVILLDTSASMRSDSRMLEARSQAQAILASLRPGMDHVSLLTFGENIHVLTPMSDDLQSSSDALATVTAGYGAGDLNTALKFANTLLQSNEVRNYVREIVVISDLQCSGWNHAQKDCTLSLGVTLSVKPVTLKPIENTAITHVTIPASTLVSSQAVTLSVLVTNDSFQERPAAKVTLRIEGKIVDEKNVNLRPHKTEVIRFQYPFKQPGDISGTFTLTSEDIFQEDNTWTFNVRVLPQINLLIVTQNVQKDASKNDGYFIKIALSIAGSPFRVREILSTEMTLNDLTHIQAIIFANVCDLPTSLLPALKNFVSSGNGVIFFTGEQTDSEPFNRSFSEIAPCRLKQTVQTTTDRKSRFADPPALTLGEFDVKHPIFEHFSAPQSGDFSATEFSKYTAVTDSQSSSVLARYSDGKPALLEKFFNKGHVLLFTSSAGIQWNNFCLHGGLFVPFIHETLRYLAVHCESQTNAWVGDIVNVAHSDTITAPDGTNLAPKSAETQNGESAIQVKLPGLYRIQKNSILEYVAVNVPRSESAVQLMDASELAVAVASQPDGVQKEIEGTKVWVAAAATTRERIESEQKIGAYLLLAVLGMLLIEHWLATRASRRV